MHFYSLFLYKEVWISQYVGIYKKQAWNLQGKQFRQNWTIRTKLNNRTTLGNSDKIGRQFEQNWTIRMTIVAEIEQFG